MKKILISVISLILITCVFYAVKIPPKQSSLPLEKVNEVVLTPQNSTSIQNTQKQTDPAHTHDPTKTLQENSVTQLDTLPKEMQQEIKTLSGRYNDDVQPIEIKPGVFIMPPDKKVQVVPVAVMNKDGKVSIHEY